MIMPTPLANGLSTDHPISGLPFVDDQMLRLPPPEERSSVSFVGRTPNLGVWADWHRVLDQTRSAAPEDSDDPESQTNWIMRVGAGFCASVGYLTWFVHHHDDTGTTVVLTTHKEAEDALKGAVGSEWILTEGSTGLVTDGYRAYRPEQITRHRLPSEHDPTGRLVTVKDLLRETHPQAPTPALTMWDLRTGSLTGDRGMRDSAWVVGHLGAWLRMHADPDAWAHAVVDVRYGAM